MRTKTTFAVLTGLLALACFAPPIWARGGGFGGGGGRGGGGGFGGGASGGGFRPAAPARPAAAARPAARPAAPQRPAAARPATRPAVVHTPGSGGSGLQVGTRPQTRPGGAVTRPDLKPGAGVRPAPNVKPRPGTLPGIPGAGNVVSRPGAVRPGVVGPGNRPGGANVAHRPAQLPGLRPGYGHGPGYYPGRPGQYPHGPHGNYHPYYHGPYGGHGGWYHGYGPAWGNGRWNYLWNQYPVAMAFGVTSWGINTASYLFGVGGGYSNPYYDSGSSGQVVDYSQPVVADPNAINAAEPAASDDPAAAADPATQAFDQARTAFYGGDYAQALQFTDQALKLSPRDSAINEFRSQCLFALGQYREAAATIHAVLAAGPGWDWTTQASLYAKVDDYTALLRKLEAYTKANPQAADASFLLGYHYLTCGHPETAVKEFQNVAKLQPSDTLAAQLVQIYSPESADAVAPAPENAVTETTPSAYPQEKLTGTWKATDKSGQFTLVLGKDADFTWSFTQGGQPQTLKGDYEVHGNQLVLEPAAGGAMISEITLKDDQTMEFAPVGQPTKMTFKK